MAVMRILRGRVLAVAQHVFENGYFMLFITIVAIMCHLNVNRRTIAPDTDCTSEESRVEEVITDSSMDNGVDFFSCILHAQIAVAMWKENHPIYRDSDWRVARIKCVQGHYKPKETT